MNVRINELEARVFQSHNGAIAAGGNLTQPSDKNPSFNPTMVRLLQWREGKRDKQHISFNPTMVRLLP